MKLNFNTDIRKLFSLDVKNFDLKSIDLNRVKDFLAARQDLLINGAVILLTLVVSIYFIGSKRQAAQEMQAQITLLEKKVAAISQLNETQNQLRNYLNSLPPALSADQIIELVSNLAPEHSVQVTSFSPAQKEEKALYDKSMIRINLVSDKYENIGRFVLAIESSKKSLRIKRWAGRMETVRAGPQESSRQRIASEIEIESVNFKK